MFFFNFLMFFLCFFVNVVFLLFLKQKRTKLQYDAFLIGKDSISWTEQSECFVAGLGLLSLCDSY